MSSLFAAVFLACACLAASQGLGGFGGWQTQDPQSDELYLELAHNAVSSQAAGQEYYDTVVELLEVQTQVVAGTNYKVKFVAAPSNCKVGVHQYSKERCLPKSEAPTKVCVARFSEDLRGRERFLFSYSCDA
ncbi:cystatin-2-like [Ornithodoros turicata]|uniref:cystatin-2-like n=1 Tax=Ornithodoros turicata TaxID=34597 RepID=UPI00313A1EF1